ncbi:hypothetical protein G9A89_015326 [Geosiphon pyriformis]|nr:hypothetical protein G9A89_015326 [Geosiphon pyriformis]
MIRKGLKAKTDLPCDFPKKVLHHSSLYDLKLFEQVQLCVSPVNNFLAEVVKILMNNELSLVNNLPNAFYAFGNFLIFAYRQKRECDRLENVLTLEAVGFKRFCASLVHVVGTAAVFGKDVLNVLNSGKFSDIYTNRFLKDAGFNEVTGRTAAYFPAVNAGIRIRVAGLMSSTLTELQTVALALKCISSSCSVVLYLDSQSAINVCMSKTSFIMPNFHNQCWIERLQIINLLRDKNIFIKYLVAEKTAMSGNVCYFVCDLFDILIHTCFLDLLVESQPILAVKKRLYNRSYPRMLCLLCDEIELSDHVFTCFGDFGFHENILVKAASKWTLLFSILCLSASAILQSLSMYFSDVGLYTAICKNFVLRDWYAKAVLVFEEKRKAVLTFVKFNRFVVELYCVKI